MQPHIVALALCVPFASATIEIAAGTAGGAFLVSATQVILFDQVLLFWQSF